MPAGSRLRRVALLVQSPERLDAFFWKPQPPTGDKNTPTHLNVRQEGERTRLRCQCLATIFHLGNWLFEAMSVAWQQDDRQDSVIGTWRERTDLPS